MITPPRFALGLVLALLFVGVFWASSVSAGDPAQTGSQNGSSRTNENCLLCHSRPNLTYEFPSGELWDLHVDPEAFENSVHGHGEEELLCVDCHTDIDGYPHPPLEVNSPRFYELDQYQGCRECHDEVYEHSLDSVHARELAGGNWDAPVCTDCHGAHDTLPAGEPRTAIPETCSQCHSTIYNDYVDSVHGEALIDENNTDVPTCIDCHGVHNQEDPTTASFRLNSPNLCAECHADEALMDQYDLSTNVFDTYVADFHGTTVTLFEHQNPDLPTNKAVCYDCHGVHNMKSADDPESQVFKENLLATCQKCHPDASENFSATWLSHYEPDLQTYPLVYFVDLFYKIMIPGIVGFMGVYVALDVGSRYLYRVGKKEEPETQDESENKSVTNQPSKDKSDPEIKS